MRSFVRLHGRARALYAVVFAVVLAALAGSVPERVQAVSTSIVISQVYGGGGNSGAVYLNDFVELFNRGTTTVSLNGWSIQYASASGTGNFGSATNLITPLSGSLAPGQYLLVQEAAGAGPSPALPTPDVTDSTPINISGMGGKVALVNSTTPLGCNGGSNPCTATQLANIIDLVGWDGANFYESAAAPATTSPTAVIRKDGGCTETDNNANDFVVGTPTPRNTSSTLNPCAAPHVISTTPANGAVNVARNANISITFDKAVNFSSSSYTISCATSGAHSAVVSGGTTTYTLNPDVDFAANESCTVTVVANQVSTIATPVTFMQANYVFSFTTVDMQACGDPATAIHTVQGSGLTSPMNGATNISLEGIVVGDYQSGDSFKGFYLQAADAEADADPATSEGIFVFDNGFGTDVALGDRVRVKGNVTEFTSGSSTLTELANVTLVLVCSTGNSVTPATVSLPVSSLSDWERYEGMLVTIPQLLTVSENFTLGRYGEVTLSNGRLQNPTNITTPGAAAIAQQDLNDRSRIVLDDGDNRQNIDPTVYPTGGLSAANTLRGGYTVNGITGVLDQRFSVYRLQPVGSVNFNAANPRTSAPSAVGGNVKVASANVLNFFNGDGLGGGFPTARGANTLTEFNRQRAKIINEIATINADIVGLMEIENDPTPNSAIEDLVSGLNATMGAGTYAFINTGVVGTDAIRVALIYKPASVTPVGAYAVLNSAVDPNFIDTKNRPSIAQTFQRNATGAKFTVVVNHLKSKGSDCNDVSDPDTGDGQGNCNLTRTKAAQALVNWLATDPTGSGDPDVLLIGDMNAYAKEDPITAFKNGGYTNLIETLVGNDAYSFVFQAQSGYLDHALSSASLSSQVTGVTEWHINADEPIALDYNTEFKTANQINTFYSTEPYRASDHDPVIIGLNLNAPPTVNAGGPYSVNEGGSINLNATGNDPDGDTLSYAWDLDNNGSFETTGQSVSFSAASIDGPATRTVKVRVSDGSLSATASVTITINNAAPSVSNDLGTQNVQYSDPITNVTVTASDYADDVASLGASTQWSNNGGTSWTAGLPSGLSLSAATCGSANCTWTLSGLANLAPATYVVRVSVGDKDGGSNSTDVTIVVTREDARATYTGPTFVATLAATAGTAVVTLRATIQDITAVAGDPAFDNNAGSILNANVTFVNRDNGNSTLCVATLALINPSDSKTATATCNWTATLGSNNSVDAMVGIVVDGYYVRDSSQENEVVTVSKPLDNFITGGGYLVLSNSAGQKPGDANSKANYGFNVKFNKNGTNLQGRVNLIVRSNGRVYQIKSTSIDSLGVKLGPGGNPPSTAQFVAKANIQDITDPNNTVTVEGNASIQMTMTDNGEPGASDMIGFTIYTKSNVLWFSSNWNGAKTVEQTLGGGNLVVR